MRLVDEPILGLTLHQPVDWHMAGGFKVIENRTWPLPSWAVGKLIALHSGKAWNQEFADKCRAAWNGMPLASPTALGPPTLPQPGGAIVAVGRAIDCSTDFRRLWTRNARWIGGNDRGYFFGPYGWLIVPVTRTPTLFAPDRAMHLNQIVPCVGRQKLWSLPADVKQRVFEQLRIVDSDEAMVRATS